jgi:SPP1 gp7 family putative phage head morphogenesis protein
MMTNELRGGILTPNASIGAEYSRGVLRLMAEMHRELSREIAALYADHATDSAMDSSLASQARISFSALTDRWEQKFSGWVKTSTDRMMRRTLKNSDATLRLSLKEMSARLSLSSKSIDANTTEVIKAGTTEAANLIRLIPTNYLSEVQGQVMRSITSGTGLAELTPYLTKMYDGKKRHAELTALDQTRKAYNSITLGRMKAFGVRSYEWLHSGGSKHPRPEHVAMNGKIYRIDTPPLIGRMYGEDVYGIPGQLPACRCKMRAVIKFDDNE